jgi:hypothetical protein
MRRRLIASLVLGGMMAILARSAPAEDAKKTPDATLKLSEGTMALGVGWSWGKGELMYKGKTYKFKVDGLSVVEVGMTKAEATGKVYNLKKVEDLEGVYAAAGAGATAGKGVDVTALVNKNGVEVDLKSETKGASLKLAAEGIKIKLEK